MLEPILDHRGRPFLDLLWRKAHPAGFVQVGSGQAIQRCASQPVRLFGRHRVEHVGAAALLGGDDAGLVQDAVGTGDGVEIDAQLGSHLPYGWELISWPEHTGRNQVFDAFDQLNVDWRMAAKIEFAKHRIVYIVPLYLCIIV